MISAHCLLNRELTAEQIKSRVFGKQDGFDLVSMHSVKRFAKQGSAAVSSGHNDKEAGNEQFPEQNITGSAKLDPAWRDYLFSSRKGVEWMDEISITLFRSKRSSYLRERESESF
ncbi:unnamed protein product [Enterobius vermicularis]|uniref:Uncharacterized protein n=1 Tax=Enterobius vermicularis TaxID=51028 RepID=A0A0N4UZY4_ENTVE|nr:unnamed protein product [Enterobius vermicularis]